MCVYVYNTCEVCLRIYYIHRKTLIEIATVLSTNSGSFPSNSHVSATFQEFWDEHKRWVYVYNTGEVCLCVEHTRKMSKYVAREVCLGV